MGAGASLPPNCDAKVFVISLLRCTYYMTPELRRVFLLKVGKCTLGQRTPYCDRIDKLSSVNIRKDLAVVHVARGRT